MITNSGTRDMAMTLVEQALLQPEAGRQAFLREKCGADTSLCDQAMEFLEWEQRMRGFLDAPLLAEPPEKAPFEPGQLVIGRFQVIRKIGHGGMGTVWEAFDTKLDRRLALKCGRRGHAQHLSPEVRNAREISHPNVCKIYEIHTATTNDGEADFLCMEFLEGETLSSRLHSGPLPKDEALVIARQICAGLHEAHRNRVIHGDLKTNNIFITRGFEASIRAVITDFGLARSLDGPASPLGGTPAYMAPELWKGVAPSVSSDIYALGILLWEMRSGRPPSELGTHSSTISEGLEHTGWKPPSGRDRWSRVIARCLHLDPAKRFQDATEVSRALGLPKRLLWSAAAAAAALLAVVVWTRAIGPAEHIDLAMMSDGRIPSFPSVANAWLETESRLAHLHGTSKIRYRWVRQRGTATHILQIAIVPNEANFSVRAMVTEQRSGMKIGNWAAVYRLDQMHYAPTALAGFVTGTLHLVPISSAITKQAQALVDAGYQSVSAEDFQKAVGQFEEAIRADPDSAVPFAGMAEAQFVAYQRTFQKSWFDKSAASLREAQMRNPDSLPVHLVAGMIARVDERYEEAVGEYLRVLELEPSNGTAYRRLALVYRAWGRREAELAALKKAVDSDPRDFHNRLQLGQYYVGQSEHEKAIEQLEIARQMAPQSAEILFPLEGEYKDIGRFGDAERILQADARLRDTPRILAAMGVLRMSEDRNAEAVVYLSRALQADDSVLARSLNVGTAEFLLGNRVESSRAYVHALELADKQLADNPQDALLHGRVGYLCARLGQKHRAAGEIGQALKLNITQQNSDVVWMAALTYEVLLRRNDTIALLKDAPHGLLEALSHWPEVAGLTRDSRFIQLLASQDKKTP